MGGAPLVIDGRDLAGHVGQLVHVEGWGFAAQFVYEGTVAGRHRLVTPVSRRGYTTKNRLLYTRRQVMEGIIRGSRQGRGNAPFR